MTKRDNISNIRGIVYLTMDAINGVTHIIEDVQKTIISIGGVVNIPAPITTTISRFTLYNVRVISQITGGSIDLMLQQIFSTFIEKRDTSKTSFSTLAAISALNGVLGDYLKKSRNPLEIKMQMFFKNKPLFNNKEFPKKILNSQKIVLMVHGSSMNHLQWKKKNFSYAESIEEDLGYDSLFLYYNTGLHISENGKLFSKIMEKLSKYISETTEIVIISHSMGGLISRSAYYYGEEFNCSWIKHLKKIIFIGVPHHGAILERSGNFITNLMELNPYIAPFSRLGKIRSAGITDLRYGSLLEKDWKNIDRFKFKEVNKTHIPLPEDTECYSIATIMIGKKENDINNIIGDGLVTINSAMGVHKNPDYNLNFPETNKAILSNINHLGQLYSPKIYGVIKKFIEN